MKAFTCLAIGVVFATSACLAAGTASADTVAFGPTGETTPFSTIGIDSIYFTPNVAMHVTQLGLWNGNTTGVTRQVGIFLASDGSLIGSISFASGPGTLGGLDPLAGFTYGDAIGETIYLDAFTQYVLVNETSGAQRNLSTSGPNVNPSPDLSFDYYAFNAASTFAIGLTSNTVVSFGADFQYNVVPLPLAALTGLGCLAVMFVLFLARHRSLA